MKKLNLFLVFVLVTFVAKAQNFPTTSWIDVANTSWYDAGQTEFTISNAEDFAGVAQLVLDGTTFANKTLLIDADINLDGNLWTPIGKDNTLPFSGSVEGNNHIISNLLVNFEATDFAGLFGYSSMANFSNLHIDTAQIVGFDNVGTLVANLFDNGSVENCSAINISVTGNNSTGGLVGGFLTNSSISNSHAIGNVSGEGQVGGLAGTGWDQITVTECFSEGTVTATFLAGGLVGAFPFSFTAASTINNSYSRSAVVANLERAGGITGGADNALLIKNSYATGTVTATDFAGAIIGFWGNLTTENVYFDKESSAMTNGVGGFGGAPITPDITDKTTAEMKSADMVDLLNAGIPEGPWSIDSNENDGYPILNFVLSVPQNQLDAASITVYPTIFEDNFSVIATSALTAYSIFTNTGARVSSGKISGENVDITASSLSAGLYFIKIDTVNGSIVKRIIKK